MKNTKFILLAWFIFASVCNAQSQTWQWAHSGGGNINYPDAGYDILVSPNGRIYCMGAFAGTITLDSVYLGGSFFIVKYTPEGIPDKTIFIKRENQQSSNATFDLSCNYRGQIFASGQMDGGY